MIKKLLLSVSLLALVLVSNAQFKKGSILIGGDIGFSKQINNRGTNAESTSSSFSISPVLALATKENTFHGVSLTYHATKYGQSTSGMYNLKSYGVGYFMRKYKPIIGKFAGFLQAGANVSVGVNDYSGINPTKEKMFNASISITPGLTFPVSKKVYLETGFSNIASIYYQRSKTSYVTSNLPATYNSGYGFSSNLSASGNGLYFGFRVMLSK